MTRNTQVVIEKSAKNVKMVVWLGCVNVLLRLNLAVASASHSEERHLFDVTTLSQDGEDWIDPMDMGLEPKIIPNPYRRPMLSALSETDGSHKKRSERELVTLKALSETVVAQKETSSCCNCTQVNAGSTANPLNESIYLRRFVNVFLKALDVDRTADRLVWTDKDFAEYSAQFRFSKSDIKILQSFRLKEGEGLHLSDLDRILTRFMASFTLQDDDATVKGTVEWLQFLLRDHVPGDDVLLRLTIGTLVASWIWMFLRGRFLLLFQTCFMASVFWHWCHMYKRSLADKIGTLSKLSAASGAAPKECLPNSMSWSELLLDYGLGSRTDKCKEYHEALLVNPLIEVSPTMAVAETITSFVLLPLEHLGKHTGKFFRGLTGELSWLATPYVLLVVSVILVLVIIMAFGYKLHLPFFASFGPSDQAGQHRLQLEKQILECRLLELQFELKHCKRANECTLQLASVEVIEEMPTEETAAYQTDTRDLEEDKVPLDDEKVETLSSFAVDLPPTVTISNTLVENDKTEDDSVIVNDDAEAEDKSFELVSKE